MAVAISDCDSAAGITTMPARKNASTTDGPAILNASPGSTKMPDPIIAPIEIVNTAYRPSDRCSELLDRGDGLVSGFVKVSGNLVGREAVRKGSQITAVTVQSRTHSVREARARSTSTAARSAPPIRKKAVRNRIERRADPVRMSTPAKINGPNIALNREKTE